ncbi:choice-of-anchor L domain-containing protein [Cryomorphaceae bacterium 1068]|nr:choice-of-anchor L domain-containing protein [Cryomorphaceae bacterium 1068]
MKLLSAAFLALAILLIPTQSIAQIDLEYNVPASELSQAIAGNGVQILNPQLVCADSASGTYSITGIPDFPEGEGIILTTGSIENLLGPNNTEASTTINGTPGDPLITTITGNSSFDACILEFDVVPVGDSLRFNFTFASEEYDEYVGTPFNDFFGFFISGPGIIGDPGLGGLENIAVLPGTSTSVGINTINNGNPDIGVPPSNPEFYVPNPLGLTAPLQYDAWTTGLSAVRQVTPCDTFSIKLVIADVADPEWDSAVLIEAIESNSIALSQSNEGNLESTIEGCNNGTVTFTRTPVTDQDEVVTFFVDGTATNGMDYEQIGDDPDPAVPKTITIPANQASVSIDIIPFDDGIIEGEEFIDIFVGNPNCAGTVQDSIRVFINDSINVSIDPPLAFVCLGNSLTFSVDADDNANFNWSPTDYLDDPSIKEPTTSPLLDIDYLLTVTAAACQSTALAEIRVSDVQLSATSINIDCTGDDNGSIDLSISGGESPYEIEWVGPNGFSSNDEDLSDLAPGVYAVLVTDRDGCTGDLSVEITEVPAIELELTSSVFQGGFNVSCFEANDGQATVIPSGGTPPYSYLWNDGAAQTSQTAVNLVSGTYEVTVTDDNDCTQTGTITLLAPDPITAGLEDRTDVLCTGEATGEVTISPIGGVGPYTIVWNTVPPQFGATAVNLTAGFYTASITDINGCQGTTEIEITEPVTALEGSIAATNASCNGFSDGSATATISGGTPPYIYEWSAQPGDDEPSISDLGVGSYTLVVTDDNGCTLELPFNILEPAVLEIDLLLLVNPTCNGFDNGSISVNATGGTAPYTYSWNTDPVQSGSSINNLSPGSYTVTVTDDFGCTTDATYELTEPSALEINLVELISPSCSGFADGSIEVEAIGSTAPYSFQWNTVPPSTGPLIENLEEGSYTVTVTDFQGCTIAETFELIEPTPLQVELVSVQNVLCNGDATGAVTINISGGTADYVITWDDPANQTGPTVINLLAGTYTASIEDANGCIIDFEITITEPDQPLDAEITSQTDVLCFGDGSGAATVTATGGSGSYSYQWDDPASQQTSTATGLVAGTYSVTVTDDNGCATPVVVPVTIGGPTEGLALDLTPSVFGGGFNVACADDSTATIDLTLTGGSPPYDVLWNLPGLETSTDEDLTDLGPGTYSVTVTDANGCEATDEITLTAPTPISIESTSTPSLCFGIPTGTLDITISGGVPAYTADWTGPGGFTGTGTSFTDLEGGVYLVTIADANGCIYLDAVTVIQPDDLVITVDSLSDYNGFNTTCFNSLDGEIYTTPSGGTEPYSYQWNTAGDPNFSNQEDVINLGPGIYEAVLIDDNGCVQNEFIEIVAPDTLMVDFVLSEYLNEFNISCFDAEDGSAEAIPVNGVAPFSFVWIGPNGYGPVFDNPIEDLEAGEYSVFVEDDDGCTTVETVLLVQPPELEIALIAETINGNNISCQGGSDGSINLIFEGGTTPITISWTGPNGFTSSDEDLFNLVAGEYCVTVTDDNNCSQSECIILTEPDAISIALDAFEYANGLNLSCAGAEDGSIDATVSGGTAPLSLLWLGPNGFTSTDEDIALLTEGEYCLTVTDANGCNETECIELIAPDGVQIDLDETTGVDCFGGNNGSISINIITGSAPFDITWTGPNGYTSIDEDITDLEPGTYCVQVIDANGCEGDACFGVSEPEEIGVTFTTSSFEGGFEIACAGDANGVISTNIFGGTAPYALSWTGPDGFTSSAEEITNLGPGTYCLDLIDDNGCLFNGCVDIEEPTPLAIDPIINLPDCGDGTLAEVDLQISGSVPPYTINWSNGGDTEVISLDNGEYDVIITDANNCLIEETIVITLPESLLIGFDTPILPGGVNIACNGESTGSIDLTLFNANGIVTINWTGPNGFVSTDEDLSNLEAGEYCVSVVDELGCEANDCITLTEATAIDATFESTDVLCDAGTEGEVTITVSGGVPVYEIEWTGPAGFTAMGATISGLAAGTYCATITDANGCTDIFCVDIFQPLIISIGLTSPETDGFNIGCFGDNTGEITSTISGGTAEYDYSWTGPNGYASSDENPINLFAGEYCLTITDVNGCAETECITLTEAPGIEYTFDVFEYPNGFNTSCGDICDGSIDLSITGGTAPITIAWTGPPGFSADTEDLTDLCAGTYTVTTTDANGCVQSASVTLTQPTPIAIDLESPVFGGGFEVSCSGANTGSITATIVGGENGLTFSWSGPNAFTSEDQDLQDLFAGTYDLIVTDGNGCFAEASITLTEPAEPLQGTITASSFPSGDNISCTGLDDGSISTVVTGGTEPYEFNWNGPDGFVSSDQNIENLMAGDYTLVILDANSCVQTINISLTEPAESLTAELEVISEVLCADSLNGSLSVSFSGGSPNINIQWIGPNDFTSSEFTISDLPAGTYTFALTDANGCSVSGAQNLANLSPIVITADLTSPICETLTGIIDVSVSGGTPAYEYLWNTGDTSQDLVAIGPGVYDLLVTDGNGCESTASFDLTVTNNLEVSASLTSPACFGDSNGAIEISVISGEEPIDFAWTGPDDFTEVGDFIMNIVEGTYTLTAVDANGCSVTESYVLTEPDLLEIEELEAVVYSNGFNLTGFESGDGIIREPDIIGGSSPYLIDYVGPNGYTSSGLGDQGGLEAGWYFVTITDANQCTAVDSIELIQPVPIELPNGISPNGDGFNDGLVVRGLEDFPENKLIVFNRWGNIVYEEDNYQNVAPWVGTNESGEELPEGTYFVIVELSGIDNLKGYLELRR